MDFLNVNSTSIILFFIGLYGLMSQRSILKSIISLGVLETAVILFFIGINVEGSREAPIGSGSTLYFSDPVPQALMITSIVIGVGVTAVALTMFMHYKQKEGKTDWPLKKEERK
jgi:multicomponent Na+:H+ antiporter subunit C